VGEDFQAKLAALNPSIAAADESFEASLEHRHHGLDLNPVAVSSDADLGKAVINDGFLRAADVTSGMNEVAAGGRTFQSRGIDRGPRYPSPASQMHTHRRIQEPLGRRSGQEPSRFLHRRVVRNFREPERFDKRRAIRQARDNTSIAVFRKLFNTRQAKEGKGVRNRFRIRATGTYYSPIRPFTIRNPSVDANGTVCFRRSPCCPEVLR
jgi:hypothetical protein